MGRPKSRREKRKERALLAEKQPLFFNGIDVSDSEKMEEFTKVCLAIMVTGDIVKDVLGIKDDVLEYIYSLAYAFYQEGRYEKSGSIFHLLVMLDHRNPKFLFGLGAVRQMLEDYTPAMELYGAAYMSDQSDPTPLFRISECALKLGFEREATIALQKALKIAKGDKKYSELSHRAEIILKELTS